MRKLTVLLLAGAFLAVTGGASVARADDFAVLECFLTGDPTVLAVGEVDTSFGTPPECTLFPEISSCAVCAAAITQSGDLKLENLNQGEGGVDQTVIRMIFAEGASSSVATADDFAMLICFKTGGMFATGTLDTSFPVPAECVGGLSCSECVDAITESGLKLVGTNSSEGNVPGNLIKMVFAGDDDDDDDDDD